MTEKSNSPRQIFLYAYFIAVTAGTIEKKKKRATTKDVARIALADLAKYYDLPIVEASKNLKVGVTVLKKKCREFGNPLWSHKKIKSLDSLIHDLQEEVEQKQQEDEAAAMVVANRLRMLESEKESIERKPFMEIQISTKNSGKIFSKKDTELELVRTRFEQCPYSSTLIIKFYRSKDSAYGNCTNTDFSYCML